MWPYMILKVKYLIPDAQKTDVNDNLLPESVITVTLISTIIDFYSA